jgi:hypothetical protein
LLQTRVVVPRDFTERPQSYQYGCSIKLNVNQLNSKDVFDWLDGSVSIDSSWLGDGQTSKKIIEHIMDFLT